MQLCSPPQMQTVWKLRSGEQDLTKGLPDGGKLRGRHPENDELVQFSHPDFPNGTWGVYCPAAACGARPSQSRNATNRAVEQHHHRIPCTVCRTPRERQGGSIRRPFLPCRLCAERRLLLPWEGVLPTAEVARSAELDVLVLPAVAEAVLPDDTEAVLPPEAAVLVLSAVEEAVAVLPLVHMSEVVALGGMWCDRGEANVDSTHSDSARSRRLRQLVGSHVAVLSVSNSTSMSLSSTLSLQLDLRNERSWRTDHRFGVDSLPGRGVRFFFLDYYWLPHIYYDEHENKNAHGYGGRWFSHLLPAFFLSGGLIAILPNDNGGFLMRMHASNPGIAILLLTPEEALLYHPLYMATQSLTHDGVLEGVGENCGRYRTNESSVRQWLDLEHPFCLAFNRVVFQSGRLACERLRSLMTSS